MRNMYSYIDSPSERWYTLANNIILIDREDLFVGQDSENIRLDSRKLNERIDEVN